MKEEKSTKGNDHLSGSTPKLTESKGQLQEKENILKRSQAIAHIGNWAIKIGEEIVHCSDEACRIFGLPIGSTPTFEMFNEVIHPDDREYVENSWMTAINKGQFDITYRILTDGQLKWVAVKAESMLHKEGQTISAIGTVQDITKLKLAEEALEKRLQFQELISKISTKFIGLTGVEFERVIHDTLAEIGRYFNSDTVRLYRLSLKGDVLKIRNQWRNENLSPPEEMAEIHKMKYPNLAAHYSKGESTVFSKIDDSPQWPEMKKILKFFGTKAGVGVPLESDSIGVDVFALDKVRSEHVWPKDIVEQSKAVGNVILSAMRRREAEEENSRIQGEYIHIARVAAMGELTASLAHELKQPLTAIRSNAQAAQRFLAHEKPDLDELRDILVDIINDNRRANNVIGRLRTLMRKSDLHITELDTNNVIREVYPLIHSYEILKNISLELELDDRIPLIAGDRVQLQQVILNLILNSSEALTDTDLALRKIIVRTTQKGTLYVTMAIKDNGPGIDEKIMEHLFEPFYTTKQEGLGMGLAICRSIVEEHGGSLRAQNNPNGGATFTFNLPVFNESEK